MRDIEAYEKEYKARSFELFKVEYRRKKILEVIHRHEPANLLEIGCGLEPLFKYTSLPFENYVIVEPGKSFCENALDLATKNNSKVKVYKEFFSPNKELKQYKFDMIICSSLLHELENPIEMVNGIAEICTPESIVHFNVPNANSFHRILATSLNMVETTKELTELNIKFQQKRVFDMIELKKLVSEKFEIIESGDYFMKPFTHSQMMKMMDYGIIDHDILDGLYKMTEYMPGFGSEIYINCCLNDEDGLKGAK